MPIKCLLLILASLFSIPFATAADQGSPNVLFLAVDDLNDWIGVLGGHTQAKTPNLDKLASEGVLFNTAYCAAPLCPHHVRQFLPVCEARRPEFMAIKPGFEITLITVIG